MILVTGGAGFIGRNFIQAWLTERSVPVVNLDLLTNSRHPQISSAIAVPHIFVHADIADSALLDTVFAQYRPQAVVHFAAESHVDNSIRAPGDFIRTNIGGTFALLEASRDYWEKLDRAAKRDFRFLHVSTDEVYGAIGLDDAPISENGRYAPNNPYAASKASGDHLVRAWNRTYGLPTLTTFCTNNYGPWQSPEKLVPMVIRSAVSGTAIPIYGDGLQRRDWIYVEDHCACLRQVLKSGQPGETYNIAGGNERTNIALVSAICDLLDKMQPREDGKPYAEQIAFVGDRPGHDWRYALDGSKLERKFGKVTRKEFATGLAQTVRWYLDNWGWMEDAWSRIGR